MKKKSGEDHKFTALILTEINGKYKTKIMQIFLISTFQLLVYLLAVYSLHFLSCPEDILKENNSYYCAVDIKNITRIFKKVYSIRKNTTS